MDDLGEAIAYAGLGLATLAFAVLLFDLVEFLFTGSWLCWSIADGVQLLGLQSEAQRDPAQPWLDVALRTPATLVLYVVGLAIFFAGIGSFGER